MLYKCPITLTLTLTLTVGEIFLSSALFSSIGNTAIIKMLNTGDASLMSLSPDDGEILVGFWVDVSGPHVGLQVVLVTLLWTAIRPATRPQFSVVNSLVMAENMHSWISILRTIADCATTNMLKTNV